VLLVLLGFKAQLVLKAQQAQLVLQV